MPGGHSFLSVFDAAVIQHGVDGSDDVARVALMLVLASALSVATTFEGPCQADFFGTVFRDGCPRTVHHSRDGRMFGVSEALNEAGVGMGVGDTSTAREIARRGAGAATG